MNKKELAMKKRGNIKEMPKTNKEEQLLTGGRVVSEGLLNLGSGWVLYRSSSRALSIS